MEDASQHFFGNIAQKAIIEKDGHVLVCRGIGDTVWEFPGGRLHKDEDTAQGFMREIQEELGIIVQVGAPLIALRSFHAKSNAWQIFLAFRCSVVGGESMSNSNEVEEMRWVSFQELENLPMFEDCREAADTFLKYV
jgi:8-oxo-dGTP diphosphatase